MKNFFQDSLNTTTSNSTPPKILVRAPIAGGSKGTLERIASSPSVSFDKRGPKITRKETNELVQLELEQLRRENRFLKKKIHEMSSSLESSHLKLNWSVEREKEEMSQKLEGLPLSVDIFFEEIRNLVGSMVKLFDLQVNTVDQRWMTDQNLSQRQNLFQKGSGVLRKSELQKNLERLILQEESNRFERMLDLFGQYYAAKEQREKQLINKVDQLILRTNQLTQGLLHKYAERVRKQQQNLTESFEFFTPTSSTSIQLNQSCQLQPTKQIKEISRSQPFTRKHGRNKSNQHQNNQNNAQQNHPLMKFYRRSKLNTDS